MESTIAQPDASPCTPGGYLPRYWFGAALGFFLLAALFGGVLRLLMYQLAAYPIERPVLALSFLNPVAIARVLVIMKTEASALLGLSGAVFRNFFGSAQGSIVAVLALLLWAALPYGLASRKFRRKDL